MNYDQARQLADGSGWHWTSMNDGRVRTAGPCRDEAPHATREEAERHFYEHSLEQAKERKCSWTACAVEGCPQPTQQTLGNTGFWLFFSETPLCDEHRSKDQLRELHPFTPGMELIHS